MSTVVGILPAAGRGRRIAGLRWRKDLYPIGWEEILVDGIFCRRPRVVAACSFDAMADAGARKMFMIVGEGGEVMRYFGTERTGVPIAYLYQEEARGAAFAIDLVRPWLPPDHTILFGFPDTLVEPFDAYARLLETHRSENADLTLGLFPTDRPSAFGMVQLDSNRPVALFDKPENTDCRFMYGMASWGPALTDLQTVLLGEWSATAEAVPADLFTLAINRGLKVRAHVFEEGQYIDIGTAGELNRAMRLYRDRLWTMRENRP